jgi:hypothetical protein
MGTSQRLARLTISVASYVIASQGKMVVAMGFLQK